ncbi:MAG: hypothetical protein IJ738_02590 [Alphaproteobacteria bacterium]|nr:hypothetical protein [Alphaproteobacteria bacterium]
MSKREEAVALFQQKYGTSPKKMGFQVMDIYEKQGVFLYAVSEDVIRVYKMQQNIIRWLITKFTWIITAVVIVFFAALFETRNPQHPICIAAFVLIAFCALLPIVLAMKGWLAKPLIKLGKNITFISYAKDVSES